VAALAGVRSVGAITGAGVSQESGVPTYRGPGGLYDDPAEGEAAVEALTGRTLARDPDRTWRVLGDLARRAAGAEPNAGHLALARMEAAVERFVLLTQNVDGLHLRAGSRNVIDLHGDLGTTRCLGCGARARLERAALAALRATPRCDGCGGALRPDAVLFGELLPEAKVARMQRAFGEEMPDLVLVAGTSALFPYIAGPVLEAARRGRLTVEVNPEPTDLSGRVAWSLRGTAAALLPLIAAALPSRG